MNHSPKADGETTSVDSLVNLRNSYDDWDFSRTQSLQADQKPTFATSTTNMTGGTLRLPSLKSSGASSGNNGGESFRNTNIEHLELGNFAGSLMTFGTAKGDGLCGGSTKLRTIVLSATNDESVAFTIYGNSCADSAMSLRAVFLTTDRMPTFDASVTSSKPAFGFWNHPALSMCIYVPTNSTAFADLLAAAKASADYDAAAGTIWNGDWKLRVQTVSGGLKVAGADANVYGNAFVTAGQGELDLSAPVKDASDNAYTIVSVGARALSRQNKVGGDGPVAVVYPTTLTALDAGSVAAYCADPYSEKLQRVELACPNLAGEQPSELLGTGETMLSDLYLNLPGVTALGETPIDAAGTNLVGDVGEWNLSGLKAVPAGLFTDQAGLTGTLRLPYVASLAADALAGSGLEEFELGTGERVRMTSIGAGACASMRNLRRIEFGPRAQNLTVAADAFDGSTAIERIEFHARMPFDTSAVANMLSSVPTLDAKQTMVVGSPMYGLEAYLANNPTLTAEEQAAAEQLVMREGETLAGVCLDSQRKAWLVGRAPVSSAGIGFMLNFR